MGHNEDFIVLLAEDPPDLVLDVLPDLLIALEVIEPLPDRKITVQDLIINGVVKVGLVPLIVLLLAWAWPY